MANVTLEVLWADGKVERITDTTQKIAEKMAELSGRPAPPEMDIVVPIPAPTPRKRKP